MIKFLLLCCALFGIFAVTANSEDVVFLPPVASDIDASDFQVYRSKYLELNQHSEKRSNKTLYVNSLVLSQSPYLLKHANNPINWKTWAEPNIRSAAIQDKPIFLSIGFFACYWCQVMESESFQDLEVAEVLNSNFISLKVDREVLPQLDSYMTAALTKVKGEAGWPLTAVLTPSQDIIFIDSYLTKTELLNLLKKISDTWQHNRALINKQKAIYQRALKEVSYALAKTSGSEIDWEGNFHQLKNQLDLQNGGLSGAPNFPEASLLLLLIDSLQRSPDATLEAALSIHLNSMMHKGLYDPVFGGFHRYTSDSEWTIPHYEKMLYTQALMLEVYSRAYRLHSNKQYKATVQHTLGFVKQFLSTGEGLFMGSVDASFDGVEGGMYLYNQQDISRLAELINGQEQLKLYKNKELYGIHYGGNNISNLETLFAKLRALKDVKKVKLDKKVVVAWNALLISGLKEAFVSFGSKDFQKLAVTVGRALSEDWQKHGKLRRIVNHGEDGTPASMEDYAYFLRALLDLYDITSEQRWLNFSVSLLKEMIAELGDEDNQLRFSNEPGSDKYKIALIDGELLNAKAVMLQNLQRLNKINFGGSNNLILDTLQQELSNSVAKNSLNQLYASRVIKEMELGSLEPIQYFAKGNGRVEIRLQANGSYAMLVNMKEGWHINSHVPLDDDLIATQLVANEQAGTQAKVYFPEPKIKALGDTGKCVSVFDKRTALILSGYEQQVSLTVQACSTNLRLCLQPETLRFYLADQ